jgi:hypothetical protein
MPLAELMSHIQELPKIDKLRLMQFLVTSVMRVAVKISSGTITLMAKFLAATPTIVCF